MKKILFIIIALLLSYNSFSQCTITSLPYSEDFTSYGQGFNAFPTCWYSPNSGTNNMFINWFHELVFANYSTVFLPVFDSSINIKDLSMFLNIKYYSSYGNYNDGKMFIGVINDTSNFSSFDTIEVLSLTFGIYYNVNVNFNKYQGNGKYIVFKGQKHYINNLIVDYTPPCPPPYNLKSSTNSNIAKLTWLPGNDNSSAWWVYYKANTGTSYDSVFAVTPSCTLSNLLPNTNYTAFLRAFCDTTMSQPFDTISFKTYCSAIDSLPYVENFNTYSNASYPPCWQRYNSDNNASVFLYSNAIHFYGTSNNRTRMAMSPYFSDNISLNTSMLKFRFMAYDYIDDTVMRPLIIGSMTDVEDINTFDSITTVYADYDWKNIDLNLAKYNFMGNYIVFKHHNANYEIDISNVIVDNIPPCPRPINIKADSITKISANISWDLFTGGESMWKIYYKPEYNQTYDSLITNTNSNILNNLLPSTNYQAYIVTLCDTLQSLNSDTLFFKTICATIDTLPFIEDFTRTGINAFPNCWITDHADKLSNGTMYLREEGYFITPEIDNNINISDLIIRFKASLYYAQQYNEDNPLIIGVMSNPYDTNTFDTIAVLKINNNSEYDISLENYYGNGKYISFKKNFHPFNIIIDDLLIDYRSNYCVRADSLSAFQDTTNMLNANLSWIERNSNNLGYWVCSKLNNSNLIDSFYTTNNYITLQNLLPNSSYTFYIKNYCSVENDYIITAPIYYNTPCLGTPISVFPYTEDFNSGVNCWILKKNGELKVSRWSSENGYAKYAFSHFYSYSEIYDPFLVSPAFNFTTNMELSFRLHKNSWMYSGQKIRVYLNSSPDTNGAVMLGEVETHSNGSYEFWDTISYQFPINSFGIRYLIFQGVNDGNIYIEDVIVKDAPTCPSNYNLRVNNINDNYVDFSWENSIQVPQFWIISYQAIDSSNFNPNSPLATNFLIQDNGLTQAIINGLSQGTIYSFALRPLCDTNWSNIISIRTMQNAQLPYFTDFSDTIDNSNWFISNENAVNGWFISSALNDSLITDNSLLISNNNGVNNTYNISQRSCVTASRQFESTGANEYTLKFDLRMRGESGYDYLKVFVVNKDTNYLAGTTQMYYANKTFNNNAVLFGGHNNTCPTCSYYTKGDSIMTSINIKLGNQGPAGNIRKLVFVWYNDHSLGFNPPPAIDNISLTNYVKEIHISDTICKGTHYNFYGQNIDSTGTYTHQFQTSNILDSIIYLNILVKPSYHDTIFADICQGETYNQFGFNDSVSGFYTQNLQTVLGCDSIVNLNLNVHSVLTPSNLILDNISNYIELTWNGDEENYIIYKDNDSLAITNLKVYRDTNVVAGENYCYKIKALTGDCYSDYSSEECMIFSSIGSVNTYNLNVTLYPNPTENKTILRFDGEKENADIHIYDINGKLVKTLKLKAEDDELEINVQGFEKGVYNIRITNSKLNIIKKLIII